MKRKKILKRLLVLEQGLFPDGLSDEVVWAMRDCLQTLHMAFESRYLSQLMRHRKSLETLYDPEHPWRTPPPL
jgi:hypothetical protein